MKALFWSAVISVVAVPIVVAMMVVVSRRNQMGALTASRPLIFSSWPATGVLVAAAVAMFAGR